MAPLVVLHTSKAKTELFSDPCNEISIMYDIQGLVLNTLEGHVEAAIKDGDVDAEIVKSIPVAACISRLF